MFDTFCAKIETEKAHSASFTRFFFHYFSVIRCLANRCVSSTPSIADENNTKFSMFVFVFLFTFSTLILAMRKLCSRSVKRKEFVRGRLITLFPRLRVNGISFISTWLPLFCCVGTHKRTDERVSEFLCLDWHGDIRRETSEKWHVSYLIASMLTTIETATISPSKTIFSNRPKSDDKSEKEKNERHLNYEHGTFRIPEMQIHDDTTTLRPVSLTSGWPSTELHSHGSSNIASNQRSKPKASNSMSIYVTDIFFLFWLNSFTRIVASKATQAK